MVQAQMLLTMFSSTYLCVFLSPTLYRQCEHLIVSIVYNVRILFEGDEKTTHTCSYLPTFLLVLGKAENQVLVKIKVNQGFRIGQEV